MINASFRNTIILAPKLTFYDLPFLSHHGYRNQRTHKHTDGQKIFLANAVLHISDIFKVEKTKKKKTKKKKIKISLCAFETGIK